MGVPCERVQLSLQAGDTLKPEFLNLNPNGRVPTLVHDGTVLWESAAITLYLGETFGEEPGLFPPPGPKRGEAMKWIVWSNVTLAEAAGRLSASLPTGAPGAFEEGALDVAQAAHKTPHAAAKAKADVADCLRLLNDALRNKEFLLGNYSLADTHVVGFMGWLQWMGVDLTPYPSLQAWVERCQARPALAALMQG